MPNDPSVNRGYFRFKHGDTPDEDDLNTNLVEKVDTDVHALFTSAGTAEGALAALTIRLDAHADGDGNLTATPPEFSSLAPIPVYVGPTQFYVIGNYTNELTVDRALQAILDVSSPVSAIKVSSYDGGPNRTNITLFDAILDATVSQVKVGFIKNGLPRIPVSQLDFDPATQVELDAHKAGADHDTNYLKKAANVPPMPEIVQNNLIIQHSSAEVGGSPPRVAIEDTHVGNDRYRRGRIQQLDEIMALILVRPDTGASKTFVQFDGVNDKQILQQPVDANSKAIVNLPAPSSANAAARLVDIPTPGASATNEAIGDSASAGAAATVSRSDHRHGMPSGSGTPVTQAFSDAAGAGSAAEIARSDHRHGMPAVPVFGKVTKTDGNVTSTGSFADVPGLSITLTTQARRVRITFYGASTSPSNGIGNSLGLRATIDGTAVAGQITAQSVDARFDNACFSIVTDVLTAASHIFKIQIVAVENAPILAANATYPAVFSVEETFWAT